MGSKVRCLVLSALAIAALGCEKGSSSGSSAGGPAASGNTSAATGNTGSTKVAFLLSTLQEERYQKDRKYFEDKAKAMGLSAFTLAADNDNAKQLSQLEDALSRGAKVVVVQPTDSVAAASYVEKAHAKGAKVVAYDRSIKSAGVDAYVAHDSFEVGKLLADAAVKATGGKGNYLLLDGQSGHSVANEIARGVMSVLKPLVDGGAVKIVAERNHDSWSPEQSLKTVEDALAKSKNDIQAIIAHNSGMARGAVQAIQAANLGGKNIFIGGADADAANVNYVCEGKQSVEVLKDIKPLAEKAAEVASALAANKPLEGAQSTPGNPPTLNVAVKVVTKETAKPLLVDSGFHAAKAVPACK